MEVEREQELEEIWTELKECGLEIDKEIDYETIREKVKNYLKDRDPLRKEELYNESCKSRIKGDIYINEPLYNRIVDHASNGISEDEKYYFSSRIYKEKKSDQFKSIFQTNGIDYSGNCMGFIFQYNNSSMGNILVEKNVLYLQYTFEGHFILIKILPKQKMIKATASADY